MSPSVSFNEASERYKLLESVLESIIKEHPGIKTLKISKDNPYLARTILPLRRAMEHLRLLPFRQRDGFEKIGVSIAEFNLAYSKYRDFVQMKECEVNRDELRWFGEYLDVYEQNAEKMLDLDVLGKEIE